MRNWLASNACGSWACQLGSCRMGNDPKTSVVDSWCRAWDVPNLFICDGSVFVTSSGVNPSLTIQAIATRTADYIIDRARSGDFFHMTAEQSF